MYSSRRSVGFSAPRGRGISMQSAHDPVRAASASASRGVALNSAYVWRSSSSLLLSAVGSYVLNGPAPLAFMTLNVAGTACAVSEALEEAHTGITARAEVAQTGLWRHIVMLLLLQ